MLSGGEVSGGLLMSVAGGAGADAQGRQKSVRSEPSTMRCDAKKTLLAMGVSLGWGARCIRGELELWSRPDVVKNPEQAHCQWDSEHQEHSERHSHHFLFSDGLWLEWFFIRVLHSGL